MMDRLADLTVSRKRVLDASEQERVRIGRHLHEGVCQELAGICMELEVISETSGQKSAIHRILDQVVQSQRDLLLSLFLWNPNKGQYHETFSPDSFTGNIIMPVPFRTSGTGYQRRT